MARTSNKSPKWTSMTQALQGGRKRWPRAAGLEVPDDWVHEGQTYRLPSGSCALVTGIVGENVHCVYLPKTEESQEVALRRDFFVSKAQRVMDHVQPLEPAESVATGSAALP